MLVGNRLVDALEKNGFDIETGRSQEEREGFVQFFTDNVYKPIAYASSATLATVGITTTTVALCSILPSSMTRQSELKCILLAISMMLVSVKAILATGISKISSVKREDFTAKNIISTFVGTALSYLAFMQSLPVAAHVEEIAIAGLGAVFYGALTGTKVKMIAAVVFGFSSSLALHALASLNYNTPKQTFIAALGTLFLANYVMGSMENRVIKKLSKDAE